ncbi:MAG: DUF6089 family protein [Bacteroidota bacterium]
MKKYFLVSLIMILALQDFCEAQTTLWRRRRREFAFGAGANNFMGDLGGANQVGTNGIRDFDFPAVRPDFYVAYRYRTTKETAIKVNLAYAFLYGNDKLTEEPFRNNRNCNFRSPVIELSTQFEYVIGRERPGHIYNLKGVRGWRYIQIQTYFFAGVGIMYFNPKGEYNGKWYALRPLSTEGQGLIPTRKKYSPVQLIIPFGMGFKYALSTDWSVGIEYGIRKTFTDYIDDVSKTYVDPVFLEQEKGWMAAYFSNPTDYSLPPEYGDPANVTAPGQQRGDPRDKDSYMFGIISFYYKIPKGKFTLPKFR